MYGLDSSRKMSLSDVPQNSGLSSVCGGESTVNYAAGGPGSKDAKTFTHEILVMFSIR
ncbi:MAG: hypothetical protein Ct9H90mP16_09160 [Candidatus Poseidoniales archaeon]|nr:MAG: hypothetical protein Ct9H90mP16_09160 [Candidatus Poseidoniales archaeon]